MKLVELWKCTNHTSIGIGNTGIITQDTIAHVYEAGVVKHSVQLHRGQLVRVDGFNFHLKAMVCTINGQFQAIIPFKDVPYSVSIHELHTGTVHGMCFVDTRHNVITLLELVYITTGLMLLGGILFTLLH